MKYILLLVAVLLTGCCNNTRYSGYHLNDCGAGFFDPTPNNTITVINSLHYRVVLHDGGRCVGQLLPGQSATFYYYASRSDEVAITGTAMDDHGIIGTAYRVFQLNSGWRDGRAQVWSINWLERL